MAMTKRQLLTKVDAGLQFYFLEHLDFSVCLLGGYSNIKRDKARASTLKSINTTLHNLKDDQIN